MVQNLNKARSSYHGTTIMVGRETQNSVLSDHFRSIRG